MLKKRNDNSNNVPVSLGKTILDEVNEMFNSIIIDDPFGPRMPGLADWGTRRLPTTKLADQFINVARHPITTKTYDDGSVSIYFDVPGCDKSNIEVAYDEKTSILSVASKITEENENMAFKRNYIYNYKLENIDVDTISATCDKGILTIRASPKVPTKSSIQIEVK